MITRKSVREQTEIEFNNKYYEALEEFIKSCPSIFIGIDKIAMVSASLLSLCSQYKKIININPYEINQYEMMDINRMSISEGDREKMIKICNFVISVSDGESHAYRLFAMAIASFVMNIIDMRKDEEERFSKKEGLGLEPNPPGEPK